MEPESWKWLLAAAEAPDPEQLLADTDTDTDTELADTLPQVKRPRASDPPTTAAAPPGLALLLVQWSICWLAGP
jgi:hypothetical protein